MNIGTPDAPRTPEVRRYLREFLMDEKVIDIDHWKRWLLVNLLILPTRPKKSAEAYAKVWLPEGSPLLIYSEKLAAKVQERLGNDFVVKVGMRYGAPSIGKAVEELREKGVKQVVAVPMYPQYSEAATGSSLAALSEAARDMNVRPIDTFFDDPDFIASFVEVARPKLDDFKPDFVLFSYHGLPERHVRASDPTGKHCLASADCCAARVPANLHCYRSNCFHTTDALVKALALDPANTMMSFQSRLGRDPWVKPYTDLVLPELAKKGVKRLAVMCPAFVADCLETLEEIGMRAKEQWIGLGGEDLVLVPSLNDSPRWAEAVEGMVRRLAMQ